MESRENKMAAREARFTLPGFLSVRVTRDGQSERGITRNLTKPVTVSQLTFAALFLCRLHRLYGSRYELFLWPFHERTL